ncbi:phage portal protein [Streptomyces sp. NPDC056831]|uniref:phage portal protein n=1 Tax=Streptomyces sp. NPDC056831 TaxID=3345954 RepID=UPI0036BBE9C9
MAAHYAEIRQDDAWYAGDRRRLARYYTHAPEQRRSLWGRRSVDHTPRRDQRLHVPLPGDIASTSADLLFADMPTITVTSTATQDRLNELVEQGRVHSALLSGAEQAAALSGVYLRVTWDRTMANRPLLTVVQPDAAVPEWRWGMLRAVTFWRELSGSTAQTVYRHLERHEPGTITHALYEGTADTIGRPIPLTENPETADLADSLDADGNGQTISTGIEELTAAYVPNMLPNRAHRGAPIGRSDYAAPLHDLFASLDEAWSSWMRDIRLARARLIVPSGYLRDDGPGNGSSFDEDRELWSPVNMPPNEANGITLSQFAIRVDEHQRTTEAITRQAAQSAGYSAQSFGLDGGGQPITATESDSRDARSMVTRKKKVGYWRYPLADMLHVMLLIDKAQGFNPATMPERPRVEFGDGVAESEQSTATTLDLLNRAGAVSAATKVKILHPDWDDTKVQAEAAAILAETGAAAPDPGSTYPM